MIQKQAFGTMIGKDMQMSDYWFLCRDTGIIKYFGSFPDYDEADAYLLAHGLDPVWIFNGEPEVEEAR